MATLVALLVLAVGFTLWTQAGDRRTELRRCPSCWYDMSRVKGRACPECGVLATGELALHRSRPRRGSRASPVCAAVLAVATAWSAIPVPWTHKVPTVILGAALDLRAWTHRGDAPASRGLPKVSSQFQGAREPLQRAIYQHEFARSLQAWADAVLSTDGPITDAELARLVPLAVEAHSLYMAGGATRASEYWFADDVTFNLVARRKRAHRDSDLMLRLEWALAELQYDGQVPGRRETFALLPDSLLERALTHPDPRVRVFGVRHVGRRAHLEKLHPEFPMPELRHEVERLENDPDPGVRDNAIMVMAYIITFGVGK